MKYFAALTHLALLSLPLLASAAPASSQDLDYCATVDSWTATMTLQQLKTRYASLYPGLAIERATSTLLVRTPVMIDGKKAVVSEEGQLYNQTQLLSVPYKDAGKAPLKVVVVGLISDEECSMEQPTFVPLN